MTSVAADCSYCCLRCLRLQRVSKFTHRVFQNPQFQKAPILTLPTYSPLRPLHTTNATEHREGTVAERKEERYRQRKELELFNELAQLKEARDKETFMQAIDIYLQKQSVYKRGHVDFIQGAVKEMQSFDVHKDVEVYKALMEVFPEGELVAKNLIQAEFMHFPRQQHTAMELLSAMGNNGVVPDDSMGDIIVSRFGKHSYVMKKYRRMMYWMPKFKHMNPYPLPMILPRSSVELAELALNRMAVDKLNDVTVYDSMDLESASDDTFIASAISPSQRELLNQHDKRKALFVEGGFKVWLKDQVLVYFILRADPRPDLLKYNERVDDVDKEDVSSGFYTFIGAEDEEKRAVIAAPSVHEQPEGTIMAMCITGSSSKDSLVAWINFLQRDSPCLANIPIVFSLRTPESGVQPADYTAEPLEEGMTQLESGPS
ncbi:evolutionarily conserved signaling intermediate in Toll pathway, mitochondrial-like [Watersipora subatra]|uniref:evolutionarily conserved signaling intermediate in Toll pathway, mitochondrial-like n=1 Tax=Watersipora subatra TaxID=2589382 RepID=UPI00355AF0D7